ncbi:acyltransferase [Geobacter hydrogenophilus]|nr:acyltransferase [Geobacter hydrogenophilus]MBT0894920.1 acyltransferase [Geobacter hydrogenophilus]
MFEIEDNVFIGHFNVLDASGGLYIEYGCQLTNFITVQTHSSHISIRLCASNYVDIKDPIGYVKGTVHIGKFTFVGPHSTIMPGTTIGKGCIVSAHSYLSGNYPDFSVIRGIPAKVVGDTRDIDKSFLQNHPELNRDYREWTIGSADSESFQA